jgi:hypothetical protein
LNAAGRDASESIERIGMKNANWILRISGVPLFADSWAADSFHREELSALALQGQRSTELLEIIAAVNDARIDERRGFGWHAGTYPGVAVRVNDE